VQRRPPDPSWIAGAALTVLASAVVSAYTLVSAPAPASAEVGVAAAYQSAPRPISLSFPVSPTPVDLALEAVQTEPQSTEPAAAARPAAAAPRPEPARPDPLCEGADWQRRRGEAAITRLRRPADALAVPVAFRSARADVLGLADLVNRRVDLFVRSCAQQPDALLLHVLAHELGHVLDVTHLTDELRAQWLAARGIPADTPWFGCDGCTDFATPAGDFAETYAQWQRGARSSRSQLAPAASPEQLATLADRFFRAL
jgi:hypothetical protein